jgi:polyhydroxybutyrate depolymerase
MLRTVTLLAAACLTLTACGGSTPGTTPPASTSPSPSAPTPAPGDHALTLASGGNTYKYLLHAPPGYTPDKRLPLVIVLHFYPGTGTQIRETTGFDPIADREGFLVAYPDGLSSGFNALICCGNTDDVGFLRALTAHLVERWQADPDRVYVTGISNGGDMSFRAAVEASDTFAAIGAVSGGYSGPLTTPATFVPKRPVSVITFIGTSDRFYPTFTTGLDTWRQRLKCPPSAPGTLPGGVAGSVTKARCADGSDVDVYTVDRMGHVWPGAATGQLAGRDIALPASELIWAFFKAHPRTPA